MVHWAKHPGRRGHDGASAALRGVGLRLTGPRRLVLEVVRGSDAHPTAEAVHQMVRCRLPRVSLGTVYRNLRLLVAQGLVDQFALIVAPVALGKGLPLFSELAAQTPLKLMSSKAFPGGAVAQIYRAA